MIMMTTLMIMSPSIKHASFPDNHHNHYHHSYSLQSRTSLSSWYHPHGQRLLDFRYLEQIRGPRYLSYLYRHHLHKHHGHNGDRNH